MSRILLADDSPHAQRMGELILREEGYEVVTITDGATVLMRLHDVDPDLILVDVLMPTKSGYEICEHVKSSLRHVHTRVVLVAGALEPVDEREAERVHADGVLKKPFEASLVLETVKPLLAAAAAARQDAAPAEELVVAEPPGKEAAPLPPPVAAMSPEADPEMIRAAVTIAVDASLPGLIEEITRTVLLVLDRRAK
jgi:CheY-like chemotaxis protein